MQYAIRSRRSSHFDPRLTKLCPSTSTPDAEALETAGWFCIRTQIFTCCNTTAQYLDDPSPDLKLLTGAATCHDVSTHNDKYADMQLHQQDQEEYCMELFQATLVCSVELVGLNPEQEACISVLSYWTK